MSDKPEKREAECGPSTGNRMLDRAADFFGRIVDALPDPLFVKDEEHRWVALNKPFCSLVGHSFEELIGKSDYDFFPAAEADVFYAKDREVFESGRTIENEERITNSSGEQLVISTRKSIFVDGEGNKFLVGLIRDITAIKEARGKAEEASRAKSEFLANMSHEIRTPLNAVIGMTDLLLNTTVSEGERHEYLQTIFSSGKSLLAILNDILDFSKIEARKLQLVTAPFDIDRLIKEVASLFALSAQQRDVRFSIAIADGVPRGLLGDQQRLRQVLVNLVGNALKFTDPDGRVALTVDLLEQSGEEVRLLFSVSDTGIGIAAEKLPELFHEFHQLDNSATRQHGGTGLGLTISFRLVELMGGMLGVESLPGVGSTFSFAVPLKLSSQPTRDRVPSGIVAQPVMPVRILVAEDNKFNQLLLRSILEKSGHSVTLASNGAELLERSREDIFDIILLDVQMPVMDGYETIKALRDREALTGGRPTPVVAITAHAGDVHRERCLLAGMNEFVTKPIDRNDLLRKISGLIIGQQR